MNTFLCAAGLCCGLLALAPTTPLRARADDDAERATRADAKSRDAQTAIGGAAPSAASARLTDITASAGITFTHYNGAFGKKYLPETMGAGLAFVDIDNDGDQDLILANGADWPAQSGAAETSGRADSANKAAPTRGTDSASRAGGTGGDGRAGAANASGRATSATVAKTARSTAAPSSSSPRHAPRLYLNNGDGTFVDATTRAGLDLDIYGMGIAAADYDNDGWPDLLLTAVGQNRLLHNTGHGTFVDVTDRTGLGGRRAFSTSAMWFDYDRDGRLDLFICNYVKWTPETDIYCSADGREKTYCTPEAYRGSTSWLLHNRGDGTFEDATASAGIFDVTSKSLGVTMLDYDQDGWPDVFVANDTQPNKLYRNNRNGTFTELGLQSGLAFSEDGRARAGMGVDAADFDNTGRPTVIVTNFSGEMLGLYAPSGAGRYTDLAPRSEVGRVTRHTLGWGCFFFDFDLDGLQDLLIVNGHLDESVARVQRVAKFAERPHLFLNRGPAGFQDIADTLGADFATPKVGRGAAFADIDSDGDLDLVITTNAGPAFLYRNELLTSPASSAGRTANASAAPGSRTTGASGSAPPAAQAQAAQGAQRQPTSPAPPAPTAEAAQNLPPASATPPARTLRLRLRGVASNRDAIGALVRVTIADQKLSRLVKTGSSYLSQSELPLTFGLGSRAGADDVAIDWPSGRRESIGKLAAGAEYEIQEGRGVTRTRPFRSAR